MHIPGWTLPCMQSSNRASIEVCTFLEFHRSICITVFHETVPGHNLYDLDRGFGVIYPPSAVGDGVVLVRCLHNGTSRNIVLYTEPRIALQERQNYDLHSILNVSKTISSENQ